MGVSQQLARVQAMSLLRHYTFNMRNHGRQPWLWEKPRVRMVYPGLTGAGMEADGRNVGPSEAWTWINHSLESHNGCGYPITIL